MKDEKGFTLIELIVVMVIIIILSWLGVDWITSIEKERQTKKSKAIVGLIKEIKVKPKNAEIYITCIAGFKWVVDGHEKYQLGKPDGWNDLKPISCEARREK